MKTAKALYCKFKNITFKEKIVLIIKVFFRMLGLKTFIFLGGYYQEDDDRQKLQDKELYMRFLEGREKTLYKEPKVIVDMQDNGLQEKEKINSMEEIKASLCGGNTYIALIVESLDKGGVEEVIKTLAIEYDRRNLPIKVFCTRRGGKIANELGKIGIEVIIFHKDKKKFKSYIENNRPLLVNTHFVRDFLEILHYNNIPIVEVIHNMYVFLDKKRIDFEKEKVSLVCRYIAVSEEAKRLFINKVLKTTNDKITVIGNAISTDRIVTKSRKKIREEYELNQNSFVFLVAGSIDARKNQIGIVRAWDIFCHLTGESVILVLAGETLDYEYEKKVKEIIRLRELEDSIRMVGYCDEIYNLMNAADAVIIDSYYEGWSVAATEAISLGLPLIHSRCGSGIELTANGQNGILISNPLKNLDKYSNVELVDIMRTGVNDNMEEMVSAMLNIYDNRDAWKGRKMIISNYTKVHMSLDNMVEKYLKVYSEAVMLETI